MVTLCSPVHISNKVNVNAISLAKEGFSGKGNFAEVAFKVSTDKIKQWT